MPLSALQSQGKALDTIGVGLIGKTPEHSGPGAGGQRPPGGGRPAGGGPGAGGMAGGSAGSMRPSVGGPPGTRPGTATQAAELWLKVSLE